MAKKTVTSTNLVFGNKPVLSFTKSTVPFVLAAIGKATDKDGYVINIKDKKYVLDYNGEKFKAADLIGIAKMNFFTNVFQLGDFISSEKKSMKEQKKISKVLSEMYQQEHRDIQRLVKSSKKHKTRKK